MRRIIAATCVCWAALCNAYQSNVAPLAYGMTPEQATLALGVPLTYVSGRPGSEILVAVRSAGIPGFYPVDEGVALQFRKGRLTGWKKDIRLRRYRSL